MIPVLLEQCFPPDVRERGEAYIDPFVLTLEHVDAGAATEFRLGHVVFAVRLEAGERADERDHGIVDVRTDQPRPEIAENPSLHTADKNQRRDRLASRESAQLRIFGLHHRPQIRNGRGTAQQREVEEEPAADQQDRRDRNSEGHPLREAQVHAVGFAHVAFEA